MVNLPKTIYMFSGYAFTVAERFMRYVQVDTQSDPHADSFPSTAKQLELSRILVTELKDMGIEDAHMDVNGYVLATIPSNVAHEVPVICFCAHVDTSSDSPGNNVRPIVHTNYQGQPLVLPDDITQVIRREDHPYLEEKIGEDIITASGKTLLGADDKAGVAVIMDLAKFLTTRKALPHGNIRLLFTPDEEIGRGVDKLDMKKLAADFGYTLDGSERGSLEDENFSADGVKLTFLGVSAHPGFAKDKLVNAVKVASAFIDALPKGAFSPETTSDRQGFVHPVHISGTAEQAVVEFIIRDFETSKLKEHEAFLQNLAGETILDFPGASFVFEVKEQYRNMKEVLDQYPQVVRYAEEAIMRAGLAIRKMPVRGGTDGSRLSFMGLPCPNLFTGEMAFHSKQEFVSIQDMEKAVETTAHLAAIWAEKALLQE